MIGFVSLRGDQRNNEEWLGDLAALGYRRCILDLTAELLSLANPVPAAGYWTWDRSWQS